MTDPINDNLQYWEKLERPPKWALRAITGGRLAGKTDINPQWRYQAMTEVFGPCGVGWKIIREKEWTIPGTEGQVFAFVNVSIQVKIEDVWSETIPGTGGSMLIEKEKNGLHCNDEAFKMATTDAIGTALKMLGTAAHVYNGPNFKSKYDKEINEPPKQLVNRVLNSPKPAPVATFTEKVADTFKEPEKKKSKFEEDPTKISLEQSVRMHAKKSQFKVKDEELKAYLKETHGIEHSYEIPKVEYDKICE